MKGLSTGGLASSIDVDDSQSQDPIDEPNQDLIVSVRSCISWGNVRPRRRRTPCSELIDASLDSAVERWSWSLQGVVVVLSTTLHCRKVPFTASMGYWTAHRFWLEIRCQTTGTIAIDFGLRSGVRPLAPLRSTPYRLLRPCSSQA